MHKVMAAVKEVFGNVNPREEITLERLSELTLEVRRKVEGATEEERRYVFPTLTRRAADGVFCLAVAFLSSV